MQVQFRTGQAEALTMTIAREHSDSISPSTPLFLPSDCRDQIYILAQKKGKRWGKTIISVLTKPGIRPWEGWTP